MFNCENIYSLPMHCAPKIVRPTAQQRTIARRDKHKNGLKLFGPV